jgi:hypothetical protein
MHPRVAVRVLWGNLRPTGAPPIVEKKIAFLSIGEFRFVVLSEAKWLRCRRKGEHQ